MVALTWRSKTSPQPIAAHLALEGLVYPQGAGYPSMEEWRDAGSLNPATAHLATFPLPNHLILGDNLAAMSALLPEYAGRIQLIYADPPFFTNRHYPARVGRGEDSRRPQEWQLAEGYRDHWPDIEAYLDMLYPRLALMHQLLSATGLLFLHLDWHADAYARLLLDEIFGAERLLNEIIWVYHGPSPIRRAFNRKHDTILAYTKSAAYTFNVEAVRAPYNPNTVKTFGSSPKAGFGKIPDLARGKVPEDWWYFPVVARLHRERTGYPTQKPEALLERIILAASGAGDLVADFFCGSGTAALVAARLGRQFIANDITWRSFHTTRSRLVDQATPPFAVWQARQGVPGNHEAGLHGSQLTDGSAGLPSFDPLTRVLTLPGAIRADLEEVTYWEVDPAWDGRLFHSAAQVVRPRRGAIPDQIALPEAPPGRPICLRLVRSSGEQFQMVLPGSVTSGPA
jgi:DNA modification methylase